MTSMKGKDLAFSHALKNSDVIESLHSIHRSYAYSGALTFSKLTLAFQNRTFATVGSSVYIVNCALRALGKLPQAVPLIF